MQCPFCNHKQTKVMDSRNTAAGKSVRRRRVCPKCKERFTTYEEVEVLRMTVIKRDGTKEDYNRKKVEAGLRKCLEKRPVNEERIQKALSEIEYAIQSRDKKKIESKEIGKLIMNTLRDVDEVAFIRFATVYKGIGSVESFKRVLKELE